MDFIEFLISNAGLLVALLGIGLGALLVATSVVFMMLVVKAKLEGTPLVLRDFIPTLVVIFLIGVGLIAVLYPGFISDPRVVVLLNL